MTREVCLDSEFRSRQGFLFFDEEKSRVSDPLTEAWTIQQDAAVVGFDWPDIEGVFAKLDEEIAEVREALAHGDREHARHEVGDLLFSVVNLARFLDANPGEALARTNRRFVHRFALVKEEVARRGRRIEECTLADLDAIWDAVKERGH